MMGLVSVRSLARLLGIPRAQLDRIASEVDAHYHLGTISDRTGKPRTLRMPSAELKLVQRRIAKRLLRGVRLAPEVHGGVRGKSPKTNAEKHLGKPCLITIDVRRFFPSIRHSLVYRMFRWELDCGHDVARVLTRLVTHEGQLPQGAPTSPAIANLFLRLAVDELLVAEAGRVTTTYTRFVDDIGLSGDNPRDLINFVARLLTTRRLSISRKKKEKLRIMPRSTPQKITGLLVNANRPSVPKQRRDQVRAAIHKLASLAAGPVREREMRSIRGRIGHVGQFNPGAAIRLERQLRSVESGTPLRP